MSFGNSGGRSMRQPKSGRVITRDQYDAVLLDLDGVITDTADLHAACWKQMFDEYLQKRATQRGEAFRPFDLATDYRLYVDGIGVEPYEGTVRLIHQLRQHGFKIAVVTSSENCTAVLKAAKLDGFFDVQVDGNMIHMQRLAGKPAPDTFLIAARLLGVEPARAVVVEDAISGVQAGVNGNFGLVIGVARKGNAEELKRHGAHLVVNDLGELVD
jgi:HAD superfamily hydrolase (TIGR01509 family)